MDNRGVEAPVETRTRRRRWFRHAVFGGLACLIGSEVTAVVVRRRAAQVVDRSVIVVGRTPSTPVPTPGSVGIPTSTVAAPVSTAPASSQTSVGSQVTGPGTGTTGSNSGIPPVPQTQASAPPMTPMPTIPGERPPGRWMVMRAGVLSLRGAVPSAAVAESEGDKLSRVLGVRNVLVGYSITAGVAVDATIPTYVADSPAFGPESATLTAAFRASLNAVAALLAAYPTLRLVVVGHPNGTGSAASDNLTADRVKVIVAALIIGGAAPDQVDGASLPSNVTSPFDPTVDFLLSGLLTA